MSTSALNQIIKLTKKYPELEWSGYCLHEKEGELFQETIKVHGIFLMDVGTKGATDFNGNADFAEMVLDYPELSKYRIFQVKIHSHNSIPVFHSGTDQQYLENDSRNQDLHISLVVNNNMQFFAKACRWVKSEKISKTVQVNKDGKYVNYTYEVPERAETIIQNVDVVLDTVDEKWFEERLNQIKPVAPKIVTYPPNTNFSNYKPYTWSGKSEVLELFEPEPDFEDQIIEVFGLPKKVDPAQYLRGFKNGDLVGKMLETIATYSDEEHDEFFDALSEWIIDNKLENSAFAKQLKTYLSYVEQGDNESF